MEESAFTEWYYPCDACIIAMLPDGTLQYTNLDNPEYIPLHFVEFELNRFEFIRGVYHETDDIWELFKETDDRDVGEHLYVSKENPLYNMANATLNHFKDKLLDWYNGAIRHQRMQDIFTKETVQEMDERIIRDLQIAHDLEPTFRMSRPQSIFKNQHFRIHFTPARSGVLGKSTYKR